VVPASAIAFAVLLIAGVLMAGASTDTSNKTDAEVLKLFRDNKTPAILSAFLLTLAALAFLPLAAAAIHRVRDGLSPMAQSVARSTAVLFAATLMISGALFGALAGGVTFGDLDDPSVELIKFIPQIGFPVLLVSGALSVAVFFVIVSRAGQVAAALPTWFSVLGYVAAVAMLAAVFFIPMLLVPIWAIASAFVLKGSHASRATEPAMA
jgi:hypothetical protein